MRSNKNSINFDELIESDNKWEKLHQSFEIPEMVEINEVKAMLINSVLLSLKLHNLRGCVSLETIHSPMFIIKSFGYTIF